MKPSPARCSCQSIGARVSANQLVGIEVRRLAAMEDRLGDVGREEAEPQHPGEVGAAQAGLLCHLGYRAAAAREDFLQLMGPGAPVGSKNANLLSDPDFTTEMLADQRAARPV